MKAIAPAWACASASDCLAHAAHEQAGQLVWTWEPWVLLCLALASGWYLRGWLRLKKEADWRRALGPARLSAFAAGMLALFAALVSPLDALAEQSFAAHMTQHLLLMMVAPPLLVWSRPVFVWLWAFPLARRRRIGKWWNGAPRLQSAFAWLMRPLTVWLAASAALWFWHIPGPYGWALQNEGIHTLEHLSFFLTSLAFWTLVTEPYGFRKTGRGVALVMVTTFAMHNSLLGALLTFAAVPLYHAQASTAFGMTPLADQQLAGLIMWVPAGLIHLATMALLFVGWLSCVQAYGR